MAWFTPSFRHPAKKPHVHASPESLPRVRRAELRIPHRPGEIQNQNCTTKLALLDICPQRCGFCCSMWPSTLGVAGGYRLQDFAGLSVPCAYDHAKLLTRIRSGDETWHLYLLHRAGNRSSDGTVPTVYRTEAQSFSRRLVNVPRSSFRHKTLADCCVTGTRHHDPCDCYGRKREPSRTAAEKQQ